MELSSVLFVIVVTWLVGLSVVSFYIVNFFRKLSSEVKRGNLVRVLDKVLKQTKINAKTIKHLEKELKRIDTEGGLHIQKVGLIRFNPFDEMGGYHSFALALLDRHEDGVVLTGLHTRERTRIYTKRIKSGKSRFKLSKEERKALVEAKKK